jgi:hypothetical protein
LTAGVLLFDFRYNRESHALPYAIGTFKKTATTFLLTEETVAEDEVEIGDADAEEKEEDVSKDKMIKSKVSQRAKSAVASSKKGPKAPPAQRKGTKRVKSSSIDLDSYDEGDGFIVDDEEDETYRHSKPLKKKGGKR